MVLSSRTRFYQKQLRIVRRIIPTFIYGDFSLMVVFIHIIHIYTVFLRWLRRITLKMCMYTLSLMEEIHLLHLVRTMLHSLKMRWLVLVQVRLHHFLVVIMQWIEIITTIELRRPMIHQCLVRALQIHQQLMQCRLAMIMM